MFDYIIIVLILLLFYRLKNFKEVNDCKIVGVVKKLLGLLEYVMEYIMGECGFDSCKVLRIVK